MRLPALAVLGFALLVAAPALAQMRDGAVPRVSPNATLVQTVGVTDVTIHYGRPSVRGRAIFGGDEPLVPYGEVWRTGANEATAITFSTPVQIEGQALAAGTYGFFTLPGADRWTIIFNDAPDQWGAYSYDAAHDVLRVDVTPEAAPATELFTISADAVSDTEATFALNWAGVRVPFRITVDTDANIRALGDAAAAGTDWEAIQGYAAWAVQNERLLDAAERWAEVAVARQPNFSTYATQARVAAANGRFAAAVDAGTRAVMAGRAMSPAPRELAQVETWLEEWRTRAN